MFSVLAGDMCEEQAKDIFANYLMKFKRNVSFFDRLRATFHWIRFIQTRFRRGIIARDIKIKALHEEIIPAFVVDIA
jgi:hypothetical protein